MRRTHEERTGNLQQFKVLVAEKKQGILGVGEYGISNLEKDGGGTERKRRVLKAPEDLGERGGESGPSD